MQVAPTLVPLLKFYFHEEVRKAAVSGNASLWSKCFPLQNILAINIDQYFHHQFLAMPELLRSAKLAVEKGIAQGRNETYVKQLSDFIVPALVEALHKVSVSIIIEASALHSDLDEYSICELIKSVFMSCRNLI